MYKDVRMGIYEEGSGRCGWKLGRRKEKDGGIMEEKSEKKGTNQKEGSRKDE